MANNKKQLKIKSKDIVISILFLLVGVLALFVEKQFYFDKPGNFMDNESRNMFLAFVICLLSIYLISFLLNVFLFKNGKINNILIGVASGGAYVCCLIALINLVSSQDIAFFDPQYANLFITSSFTLLGFGLTISTILIPIIIKAKAMLNVSKEKTVDIILSYFVPYIAIFLLGIVFTTSSIMNLNIVDTAFYKMLVYKAFLYSLAQILLVLIKSIEGVVYYCNNDK